MSNSRRFSTLHRLSDQRTTPTNLDDPDTNNEPLLSHESSLVRVVRSRTDNLLLAQLLYHLSFTRPLLVREEDFTVSHLAVRGREARIWRVAWTPAYAVIHILV